MNKKETWEDIQKNDKKLAELLIELKNTFGRVELISYNKNKSPPTTQALLNK